MKIKNYTSTVPVSESIRRIEIMLVEFGAQHIAKHYNGIAVAALIFSLPMPDGKGYIPVRLPVRADEVEKVLSAEVRRARRGTFEKIKDQAARTAWKLMTDWIHVQCSLITLGQVQPLEVFLPYVYDAKEKRTYFEAIQSGGFKALPYSGGQAE